MMALFLGKIVVEDKDEKGRARKKYLFVSSLL